MSTPLDVLVVENRRHAADAAVADLEAAGHHVHRCFDPDSPGFPCQAIREPGTCPLDQGVDVALSVRDRIEPRPTRYEQGISCAIRAGVPIAEVGPQALDPFEPWVTCRITNDVAVGVATAAERGLDELRRAVIRRIRPLVADPDLAQAIACTFERSGHRLVVHLSGPAVGPRIEQAMAVRVLDAVWSSNRTYGQVDVAYHTIEVETVPAPART